MGALLLLDVDGPLNPWAAPPDRRPEGYVEHRFRLSRWRRPTQCVWLNPGLGPRLTALAERTGAELAWATTWGHRANSTVGPAIGLPVLPVIEFSGPHADHLPTWKYPAVARHAYGRPLAWLDDDFALHPTARRVSRQAPGHPDTPRPRGPTSRHHQRGTRLDRDLADLPVTGTARVALLPAGRGRVVGGASSGCLGSSFRCNARAERCAAEHSEHSHTGGAGVRGTGVTP